MAQWNKLQTYVKPVLKTMGDGVNEGLPPFSITDSQQSYARNMDARNYPANSVMPGRSTFTTASSDLLSGFSSDAYGLGERNNQYVHCVAGNTWAYWNPATTAWVEVTTSLSGTGDANIQDFVTGTYRYTVLCNGTDKVYFPSTSTALTYSDTNMPASNLFTVHDGRIYVWKDATLSFCALQETTDWSTVNDSGSITVTNARGTGTAIVEFANYVLAFTEHSMHQLAGSGPDDYQLIDIEGGVGCIANKSLVKCNRMLYWVGWDGIYRTDSTLSMTKLSDRVQPYIDGINADYKAGIAAGSIGDIVYISIPYGATATGNNLTLKYDSKYDVWNIEDEGFKAFVTIGRDLYGLKYGGQLVKVRDTAVVTNCGTPIEWSFITKAFTGEGFDNKKSIQSMELLCDMTTDSTAFTVGVSTLLNETDSTVFHTLYECDASSEVQTPKIVLPCTEIQNANWYKLRFAGSGPVTIYQLQQKIRERVV